MVEKVAEAMHKLVASILEAGIIDSFANFYRIFNQNLRFSQHNIFCPWVGILRKVSCDRWKSSLQARMQIVGFFAALGQVDTGWEGVAFFVIEESSRGDALSLGIPLCCMDTAVGPSCPSRNPSAPLPFLPSLHLSYPTPTLIPPSPPPLLLN